MASFRRLSDLWEVLAASFPVAELDAYARVFAAHGAAPRPLSGSRLREGEVLTWVRGGAAPVYRHDRFDLEIYDSRAQVLLHRVPDITVTGTADRASYTLTARDIERIVLATYTNRVGVGDLIWLVQGRHIDAVQTTGRYMSPFHRFGEGGISAEDASEILGAGRDIYR